MSVPPQFRAAAPSPIYNPTLSTAVFMAYSKANPLKLSRDSESHHGTYWMQTFKFLNSLHEVLSHPTHEMNLKNIKTDNYYFLIKMCVDFSFTVPDIITIRNDPSTKVCKVIANDLLKSAAIPSYISYLGLSDGNLPFAPIYPST